MRAIITTTTVTAALLVAPQANASGLSTARFGGEHGHPTTSNPTAIYYNPAGIGLSDGINIFADGNFAWRVATFERPQVCPPAEKPTPCEANPSNNEYGESNDALGANYNKAALVNLAAAPMLGASAKIPIAENDGLGIGAAFFVPFGGSSSWDKNDAFEDHPRFPGPRDGANRWWSIDGTLRALFLSGALSFSIHDLVHLGVSGGVAFSEVDTIRAKVLNNSNDLALEGRAWVDASAINAHLGGGVVLTPFRNNELRLGLSYQMPVGLDGVRMPGKLSIHAGTPGAVSEQDIDFHHVWPDVFRAGVAYQPMTELELRLFGDVTRWNLFEDQCITAADTPECRDADGELVKEVILNIPRSWNVGVGLRLGASYWVNEDIELFLGAGYDSNAIPDETLEPALIDFDDISVGGGGRLSITDWWALSLAYTQIFYIPRDTTGKSKTADPPDAKSLGPDSGGEYRQAIGFVNLNMQWSFDPFASAPDEETETEPVNFTEP